MEKNNSKPIDKLNKRFPTVFDLTGEYQEGPPPKTLVELRAVALSSTIRAKPNWIEKFYNKEIRQRWVEELRAQEVPNEIITYVFEELEQHYIQLKEGPIEPSSADGVYKADGLITEELRQELIKCIYELENVDKSKLDWHPGSNDQVLDLVHPSLFCYVIGETKIEKGIWPAPWTDFLGSGINEEEKKTFLSGIMGKPKEWWIAVQKKFTEMAPRHPTGISKKYQWLPSEFHVDEYGKVQIRSYINNLHPEIHKELYGTLERIFGKFIPLFNKTLTEALHQPPNRIEYLSAQYPEGVTEEDPNRQPIQPTLPSPFKPFFDPKTRVDLRRRNLQVIVKMANIHLTPEKPEYNGGVWHVEGMENERIIATGIYYYHTENITESKLSFRRKVSEPGYYQSDHVGVTVFGLADGAPLVQPIGSVVTEQDRCIVFPNLYQHQVAPFKLADPTKPGSRKILVFFLVDPATPVISTAVVPPQQSEWTQMQLLKQFEGTRFETLPVEMRVEILSKVDMAMSLDKAKEHRDELMKERKYISDDDNDWVFERPFSLCEH